MTTKFHVLACTIVLALSTLTLNAQAAPLVFDANVTPDVIFGSGNLNGGFTVDQDNGVEIGLRGKLRHNAAGAPENTFNSNGDGTYTFNSGVAPTQTFPTAEWSFEWSINSDYLGTSGVKLDDLTYALSLDSDPGPGVTATPFDPINGPFWDHSTGNNGTDSSNDNVAANAGDYAANIAADNVAQNSWKPHWYIPGFNPTVNGTYTISLTALSGGSPVASSSIDVITVPEPGTFALAGLAGLIGTLAVRRRRAQ